MPCACHVVSASKVCACMALPKWALELRSPSGRFKGALQVIACNARIERRSLREFFKGAPQVGTSTVIFE